MISLLVSRRTLVPRTVSADSGRSVNGGGVPTLTSPPSARRICAAPRLTRTTLVRPVRRFSSAWKANAVLVQRAEAIRLHEEINVAAPAMTPAGDQRGAAAEPKVVLAAQVLSERLAHRLEQRSEISW